MRYLPTLATLVLLAGDVASADPSHRYGRVLHTEPIYATVQVAVPRERCWQVRDAAGNGGRRLAGGLVGGIAGGVVGSQVGSGDARVVATIAGTVLGALIGNRIAADLERDADRQRRCETVTRHEPREELVGYRVKYRYRGRIYHTRTEQDPGRRIRVAHDLHPTRY